MAFPLMLLFFYPFLETGNAIMIYSLFIRVSYESVIHALPNLCSRAIINDQPFHIGGLISMGYRTCKKPSHLGIIPFSGSSLLSHLGGIEWPIQTMLNDC